MENKTAKRQALVIRLTDHHYFEEAHLFLKKGCESTEETDMVKEATRIISSCNPAHGREKRKGGNHSPLFYFVCGMITTLFCTLLSSLPFLLFK